MSHLRTFEACARIASEFRSAAATMGKFNTNFIAHEIAFMVFGNALLCGFPVVEFLNTK